MREKSKLTFAGLAGADPRDLKSLIAESAGPDLDSLAGSEWRGYNQPWVARLLGIRKFIKGFFAGERDVEGYNVPVQQNGFNEPWIPKPSADRPKRYAYYVALQPGRAAWSRGRYAGAVLLDYGATHHGPRWGIERQLRDFLVKPDPSNPDLLLGRAYLEIGGALVPSSFFVLERI